MVSLVIVTGASKGFGKALSLAYTRAHGITKTLEFVLSARNAEELEQLRDEIFNLEGVKSPVIHVVPHDFGQVHQLESGTSKLFDHLTHRVEEVVFFNNHGSLGPLSFIGTEPLTVDFVSQTVNVNITSNFYLTSEFIKKVSSLDSFQQKKLKTTIVNVSSLAAIQPFESWGVYCAGKAARDMFYKVLAKEIEIKFPEYPVSILNYAPGPLDTNMQKEIRENPGVDKNTQEYFQQLKANDQLIDPMTSAVKLVSYLNQSPIPFKNGDHVDFFDI